MVLSEAFKGPRATWELKRRHETLIKEVLCDGLQIYQLFTGTSELLELGLFLKKLVNFLFLNNLIDFVHSLIDQSSKSLQLFQVISYVPEPLR